VPCAAPTCGAATRPSKRSSAAPNPNGCWPLRSSNNCVAPSLPSARLTLVAASRPAWRTPSKKSRWPCRPRPAARSLSAAPRPPKKPAPTRWWSNIPRKRLAALRWTWLRNSVRPYWPVKASMWKAPLPSCTNSTKTCAWAPRRVASSMRLWRAAFRTVASHRAAWCSSAGAPSSGASRPRKSTPPARLPNRLPRTRTSPNSCCTLLACPCRWDDPPIHPRRPGQLPKKSVCRSWSNPRTATRARVSRSTSPTGMHSRRRTRRPSATAP